MNDYIFNKQDIENRIETVEPESVYKIHYSVPIELEDTLSILIEQELGNNYIVMDDIAELKDDKITGYVLLEMGFEFDYEQLFSTASQFDMLSKGIDLIEKVNN